MSIRQYKDIMQIQDALTGEIIVTLPMINLREETMENFIRDIIIEDLEDKHGVIIKYGIKN